MTSSYAAFLPTCCTPPSLSRFKPNLAGISWVRMEYSNNSSTIGYTHFSAADTAHFGCSHISCSYLREMVETVTVPLRHVLSFPQLGREVGGQVLMAQEHQPPPPEPDVRLVTASGSHEISYVFLIRTGCMPDQRDVFHRSHLDGSSDGIGYRQEFVFGSTVGGWR